MTKLTLDNTAGFYKLANLHYQLGEADESLKEIRDMTMPNYINTFWIIRNEYYFYGLYRPPVHLPSACMFIPTSKVTVSSLNNYILAEHFVLFLFSFSEKVLQFSIIYYLISQQSLLCRNIKKDMI